MNQSLKIFGLISLFSVVSMAFAISDDQVLPDIPLHQPGSVVLERISRDRVKLRSQAVQQDFSRRKTIRYGAYGVIGAAGVGLVSYGLYHYFSKDQGHGVQPRFSQELSQEQRESLARDHQRAVQRYYEALEQQRTFSGHVKRGAWSGAEIAIGTFVAGLILSSFAKGQEAAGSLLPGLFASDQEDYERLYRLVKRDFTSLREALMVFDVQEKTGQHEVSSALLYEYFCGEIVTDYSALVYRLELLLAFLMVYSEQNKREHLDVICRGVEVLEALVESLARSIELVVSRSAHHSIAAVAMHFRDCYVYTMKFICSSGEALYGDAFCPEY